MSLNLATRATLAVYLLALGLCAAAAVAAPTRPGWTVAWRDGQALITEVDPGGLADRLGAQPTDVVVSLNDRPLTVDDLKTLEAGSFDDVTIMTSEEAAAAEETGFAGDYVGTLAMGLVRSRLAFWTPILIVSAVVSVGIGLLILRRRLGPLRRLAPVFLPAAALAVVLYPVWQGGDMGLRLVAGVLGAAGGAVAGLAVARRLSGQAQWIAWTVVGAATSATVFSLILAPLGRAAFLDWTWVWIAAASGGPTLLAVRGGTEANAEAGLEYLILGAAPILAWTALGLSSPTDYAPWPLAVWLVASVMLIQFVQPLLRGAGRSGLERDAFAFALEAQRRRLAADLHDDPLQSLILLARRLGEASDRANAAAAAAIADRLREICYELRLPVLDDFGAGPAIEWYVEQMSRACGQVIQLEREELSRPPAEVELAVFRVAQEALANAVKHGAPPVMVRYRSSARSAVLEVEDHGPGLAESSDEDVPRHFGLINMRQRARDIEGRLQLLQRSGGGTRILFQWEAW